MPKIIKVKHWILVRKLITVRQFDAITFNYFSALFSKFINHSVNTIRNQFNFYQCLVKVIKKI